ncbi:MAG: hypothetical protein RI554_09685, partial [Trueperaceae bacterium]|nr:hypothetical protein [Trueperaceae bacterium]
MPAPDDAAHEGAPPEAAPPVGSVHLDAGRADRDGAHGLHFEAPLAVETLARGQDPTDLYARLQAHLDAGRWVAGYLTYEAAHAHHGLQHHGLPHHGLPHHGLPPRADDAPLAWFGA